VRFLGFVNLTPFAAQPLLLSDERGTDVYTFVVKATFGLRADRGETTVAVADEQVPVCLEPVYHGDPAAASLKYDADIALTKLGTDVVLIGHARPLHGAATYVDVSLTVGPARLTVRVFGDRVWTTALGRWTASAPTPFEAMPLVYERAFGGWDRSNADPTRHEYEPRNPVGVGFVSKKHGAPREGTPLPNLENPYEPIGSPTDRPAPLGFGYIGPHWQPRLGYAGTYDDRWQQKRMPLLPDDFDRRFYNAAHPALSLQGFLRGGEAVEVVNASPLGALRFWLPAFMPYGTLRMNDGETHRVALALDTIILNTDEDRLFLVWRGGLPVQKRTHDIVWSKVQLTSNGGSAQ
jgi:hypothetical protein